MVGRTGALGIVRAICLGSATCMPDDLQAAAALGIGQGAGWTIIGVNHAARDWSGPLDHWVSFHSELMPKWLAERDAAGRAPAGLLWTAEHRVQPVKIKMDRAPNWGGSSGLLAVSVALKLGAEKIVLCGIPLDHEQGHYDSPDKRWREAGGYRVGWTKHLDQMRGAVRSMSGWTRELLGAPDGPWLK
jgi:hypothetical protein